MFARRPVDRETGEVVGRVQIKFEEEGRTMQSFLDEADVNTVMGKWRTHGFRPNVNLGEPVYADVSSAEDYLSSINKVQAANELFMQLPAKLRAECDNDPGQLIEYVQDEKNRDKLLEYGVLKDSPEKAPAPPHPSQKSETVAGTEVKKEPDGQTVIPGAEGGGTTPTS